MGQSAGTHNARPRGRSARAHAKGDIFSRAGGVGPFAHGKIEQVVVLAVASDWQHPQRCVSAICCCERSLKGMALARRLLVCLFVMAGIAKVNELSCKERETESESTSTGCPIQNIVRHVRRISKSKMWIEMKNMFCTKGTCVPDVQVQDVDRDIHALHTLHFASYGGSIRVTMDLRSTDHGGNVATYSVETHEDARRLERCMTHRCYGSSGHMNCTCSSIEGLSRVGTSR
eukprot:2038798-Amphidinium_carterae.1